VTAATILVGCLEEADITIAASPVSETLLISGGMVLVMDDAGTMIRDGAVAIRDGRIEAVDRATTLRKTFPDARVLASETGLILPGLVNAHTHVPMVLFRGLADDLDLMDWLEKNIFPAEAALVDEEFVRWGTRLACLEMLTGGVTTFADMYYYEDVIAEEADRCGIRAIAGETLIDFPAPDHPTWDQAVDYSRQFVARWRGHPRITAAIAPHSAYTVSEDHLREAHALSVELEAPLLIHLAEDQGEIERVKKATGHTSIDYLESLGMLGPQMLAAHVIWPSESEIDLLAQRGVGVAHCPQSNMKIAAGVAPVPKMIAAGVAVGVGTDGAASNNDLNLWEEIDTAAKLHKVVSGDPTVLNARQALRMATIEGARALGLENQIGSLEVGKRADLVVVRTDGFHQTPSFDPFSLLVYSTKASDVETVVVEGRVVVENGKVLTLDAPEILRRAIEYRDRIANNRGIN
jgi:5-methylthioadenosine/S-adenosylhomocysteine deaminase